MPTDVPIKPSCRRRRSAVLKKGKGSFHSSSFFCAAVQSEPSFILMTIKILNFSYPLEALAACLECFRPSACPQIGTSLVPEKGDLVVAGSFLRGGNKILNFQSNTPGW